MHNKGGIELGIRKMIIMLNDFIDAWELEQADEDMQITIYKEDIEAFKGAIKALEKQIPKRPKADNNGNCAEYFEEWLECGEAIPEYTSDNETECCCVGCGQKLSWD